MTTLEQRRRETIAHRERATCRTTAWCIVGASTASTSATILLFRGEDFKRYDDLGAVGVVQGFICGFAFVALVALWLTVYGDPGVVIPDEADDRGARTTARLDAAVQKKLDNWTEESCSAAGESAPRRSYADHLRACIEDAVREDAEASALRMDRDYGGTWTKKIEDDDENGLTTTIKFCSSCKLWRPPMSSHCSTCGYCVRRFDHHCGVLGNCVGEHNHRFFLALLTSSALMGALVFVVSAYALAKMPTGEWRREYAYVLVACSLSGAHVVTIIGFAWTHWVMFVLDFTTKAYARRAPGSSIVDVKRASARHGSSVYARCCAVPFRMKREAETDFLARRRREASIFLGGDASAMDV